MVAQAHRVGWPVYPPLRRQPVYNRGSLDGAPLAAALYQRSVPHREVPFSPAASAEMTAAAREVISAVPLDAAVIEASFAATRVISSERIAAVLEILASPELAALAARIEELAGQLAERMILREDPCYTEERELEIIRIFGFLRSLPLEAYSLWRDERELSGLIGNCTPREIADLAFVLRIKSDKVAAAAIKARPTNEQLRPLIDQLRGELGKLEACLGGIGNVQHIFWSAHDALWGLDRTIANPLARISAYLSHDLSYTFSGPLVASCRNHELTGGFLAPWLAGLRRLCSHLDHLAAVLTINKYRLDGILPPLERVSIGEVMSAAAYAAGQRLGLPVRDSTSTVTGFITYQIKGAVETNSVAAFLEVLVYNLIKNSAKAAEDAGKGMSETNIRLTGGRDHQHPEVALISIEDNGTGFLIDHLISAARRAIGVAEDTPLLAKLARSREQPHILRTLTIGEVMDLAFIERLSGSGGGSGLGLAEAAEIAQLLGFDILITNRYDGGALITIVLGPEEVRGAVISRELGEDLS